MTISVFNGSPRGQKSNSTVINKWLIEGVSAPNDQHMIRNLNQHDDFVTLIENSDKVIMTFPLYADAMPAIVMSLFEKMYQQKERIAGTKYLFIIHSGFPEAKHCFGLKDYLYELVQKIDGKMYDVIIHGGSEGTRLAPEKSQAKKRIVFNNIGSAFSNNQPVDDADRRRLMKPIQLSSKVQFLLRLLSKTSLLNMYWNNTLKQNNAFEKRFDTPYLERKE